jgi:hypothetical protein
MPVDRLPHARIRTPSRVIRVQRLTKGREDSHEPQREDLKTKPIGKWGGCLLWEVRISAGKVRHIDGTRLKCTVWR